MGILGLERATKRARREDHLEMERVGEPSSPIKIEGESSSQISKDLFPKDVIRIILNFLDFDDLETCHFVSKDWKVLSTEAIQKKVNDFVFGKEKWKDYFGTVDAEPPLPPNIWKILNSPCPFWPGERVYQTHLLILVPKEVNNRKLTLNTLGEIIQNPKRGYKTKYGFYNKVVKDEIGSISRAAHWVLITRDVIPKSRNNTYSEQKELVEKYSRYTVPYVLDVAVSLHMWHVVTGKRLYSDNLLTYTRCQEVYERNGCEWPMAIGAFASGGIDISALYYYLNDPYGVGLCRRL